MAPDEIRNLQVRHENKKSEKLEEQNAVNYQKNKSEKRKVHFSQYHPTHLPICMSGIYS